MTAHCLSVAFCRQLKGIAPAVEETLLEGIWLPPGLKLTWQQQRGGLGIRPWVSYQPDLQPLTGMLMWAGLSAPLWKGVSVTFTLMIWKLIRRRLWLKSHTQTNRALSLHQHLVSAFLTSVMWCAGEHGGCANSRIVSSTWAVPPLTYAGPWQRIVIYSAVTQASVFNESQTWAHPFLILHWLLPKCHTSALRELAKWKSWVPQSRWEDKWTFASAWSPIIFHKPLLKYFPVSALEWMHFNFKKYVIMAYCDQHNRSILQVESQERSPGHESFICFSKYKACYVGTCGGELIEVAQILRLYALQETHVFTLVKYNTDISLIAFIGQFDRRSLLET